MGFGRQHQESVLHVGGKPILPLARAQHNQPHDNARSDYGALRRGLKLIMKRSRRILNTPPSQPLCWTQVSQSSLAAIQRGQFLCAADEGIND